MKLCHLLHRISSLELDSPFLSARDVFRMATETNASLLGFEKKLGRLEPGRYADLVLLDFKKMCHPFVYPSHDPIDVLLYRGSGQHVDTVMVNGRVVVQDGRLLTIDEDAVAARLTEAASRPSTDQERNCGQAIEELKHHIVRYYHHWPGKLHFDPHFAVNSRFGLNRGISLAT
jgi:5-methylthioadenosine/S-adenosylhomocysteine deaminase